MLLALTGLLLRHGSVATFIMFYYALMFTSKQTLVALCAHIQSAMVA